MLDFFLWVLTALNETGFVKTKRYLNLASNSQIYIYKDGKERLPKSSVKISHTSRLDESPINLQTHRFRGPFTLSQHISTSLQVSSI